MSGSAPPIVPSAGAPPIVPSAGASFWARAVLVVLVRPWLWSTAARQLVRLSRPGWWRRPPFFPIPDSGYLRFRFETAYGDGAIARPADLLAYLSWCRMRHA